MKEKELIVCPFCSSDSIAHKDYGGLELIVCLSCGATGPAGLCKSELSLSWNTRPSDKVISELKEALENQLDALYDYRKLMVYPLRLDDDIEAIKSALSKINGE